MPATGFVIATAQSSDVLASTTWSNQANIVVNDDTEATEALIAKNTPTPADSTSSGWIKVTTFGFDGLIPAGAAITKVEIQYRWRVNSAAGIANRDLCWALGGTRGTNLHSLATEPLTLETVTTDVTAERAWTRADLLNATFAVHARGRNGNSTTDPSYRFAWIKVQVSYVQPRHPAINFQDPAVLMRGFQQRLRRVRGVLVPGVWLPDPRPAPAIP